MSKIISELYAKLEADPWRQKKGYSNEMDEAHKQLAAAKDDEEKVSEIITSWLQKYQPCLFGRIAAKFNLLSFCILTENDLMSDDETIQEKIQSARTKWTAAGFTGKKSGFIIFASSSKIAHSLPDHTLMSLAKEICAKYLLEVVTEDEIYTDEIWLEKPGKEKTTWKWLAGVNYFCANADYRWWQDHRIPGGLAFSVNSVGHLAKSSGIGKALAEMHRTFEDYDESYIKTKVDSLTEALEFAMRTINLASDSISGKATELIDTEMENHPSACPISLPKTLKGKSCKQYKGHYHTDVTVPSAYFAATVDRPELSPVFTLDFTYLYDENINNPDHITMGQGRQIRKFIKEQSYTANAKSFRAYPVEETIVAGSRLSSALGLNK